MTLETLRKQIDAIDGELVTLLNRRAEAAKAIGQVKRRANLEIRNRTRVEEVMAHVTAANSGPLGDAELRALFEQIIEVCSQIQE